MNAIVLRIIDRHRTVLLIGAALVCGSIAVYAGSRYVNERVEQERLRLAEPVRETIDIVVARDHLERGELVSEETMALRAVPAEFVPSHAIRPEQFEALLGQRLVVPMRAGEALSSMAVSSAEQLAFSSRVKPGIRALTISVDEINSISGMLQPGDRIDLLLTARPPVGHAGRQAEHEATVPLVQNLLVLATGQQVRPGIEQEMGEGRNFSAVTVEVDPVQAQRLVVAQRAGRLTAVLRNPEDSTPMASAALDIRHLFNQPPPAAVAKPLRRRDHRPQIIMGGLGQARLQPLGQLPAMPAPVQPSQAAAEPAAEAMSAVGARLASSIQ